MTCRLLLLALLFAAFVGCVRTIDLDRQPADAQLPDGGFVPDAQMPRPDASPLDAEIPPDAAGAPDASP